MASTVSLVRVAYRSDSWCAPPAPLLLKFSVAPPARVLQRVQMIGGCPVARGTFGRYSDLFLVDTGAAGVDLIFNKRGVSRSAMCTGLTACCTDRRALPLLAHMICPCRCRSASTCRATSLPLLRVPDPGWSWQVAKYDLLNARRRRGNMRIKGVSPFPGQEQGAARVGATPAAAASCKLQGRLPRG